jgi:hypothetical protein
MDLITLQLFNEKVDRLDRCRLAKRMETRKFHFQSDKQRNREWISVDDVSEDDVDAFVLNLRLLIQPRDGFSYLQIYENIYLHNDIPEYFRKRFEEEITLWDDHLSEVSIFGRLDGQGNYSNKELFDILFYGGLAHMNPENLSSFYSLTKQGLVSTIIFCSFLNILNTMLTRLRNMRQINRELLDQLDSTKYQK